jgi:proteasome lid subunit RPN8/RPN11
VDAAADDVHVFIPRQVVEEAVAIANRARTVETGGVLVGSLHRAASTGDIFVEVTAQVPALHTESSAATLTFTPETWSAVRAAIDLRGQDELLLGWLHSHPNFCQDCPPERKNRCLMSRSFFSATDCHLHRTVFSRAYQIGLLLSDHGEPELELNLFGWRHGSIESRGFHVLEDSCPSSQREGTAHATH